MLADPNAGISSKPPTPLGTPGASFSAPPPSPLRTALPQTHSYSCPVSTGQSRMQTPFRVPGQSPSGGATPAIVAAYSTVGTAARLADASAKLSSFPGIQSPQVVTLPPAAVQRSNSVLGRSVAGGTPAHSSPTPLGAPGMSAVYAAPPLVPTQSPALTPASMQFHGLPGATRMAMSPTGSAACPSSILPTSQLTGVKVTPDLQHKIRAAFDAADKDKSGELDSTEWAIVASRAGLPGCEPMKLKNQFRDFDADKNGKVSFAEFMSLFHPSPSGHAVEGVFQPAADGKLEDTLFPPDDTSIFRTSSPVEDHLEDLRAHIGNKKIEWVRATELCQPNPSLFNSVHPNDIAPGVLGDCWFLAALAAMAEFEGAPMNLFKNKSLSDNGKYTINLFNAQTKLWEAISIDDKVPVVDGDPLMCKPQGNEIWVLLLEKAMAKWFGSYVQLQGAYNMVAFMILVDCKENCKVLTQSLSGGPAFNTELYYVVDAFLRQAKDRNSVGLQPKGKMEASQLWAFLTESDKNSHIMVAWTLKDAGQKSGTVIGYDGIAKGHAYSIISAKEVTDDTGKMLKCIQMRNPFSRNPSTLYKGELGVHWPGWDKHPKLKKTLYRHPEEHDGTFWMPYDAFRARFSDIGVVPVEMPTCRIGSIPLGASKGKHGRRKHAWDNEEDAPSILDPAEAAPGVLGNLRRKSLQELEAVEGLLGFGKKTKSENSDEAYNSGKKDKRIKKLKLCC